MKIKNLFGALALGGVIATTVALGGLWAPTATAAPTPYSASGSMGSSKGTAQPQMRMSCWDRWYRVTIPMPNGGTQIVWVHDVGCEWV